MNEDVVVVNSDKVKLSILVSAWKDMCLCKKYVIELMRNMLLITAIVVLFQLRYESFFTYIVCMLIVYCIIFATSIVMSKTELKSFLGLKIYFFDKHIEWLDRKIEYKLIKKIIVRDKYIIVATGQGTLIMFCQQDSKIQVTRAYEIMKSKCWYIADFDDIDAYKKKKMSKIAVYVAIYGYVCTFYIHQIVAFPETFLSYKESFLSKYGICMNVLAEDSNIGYYSIEKPHNVAMIYKSIDQIDKMLSRFPGAFWDGLRDYVKINIIICDDISQKKGDNISGLTYNMFWQINVYFDYDGINVEETIAHEMFHVMTNIVFCRGGTDSLYEDVIDGKQWDKFNSVGFDYGLNISEYREGFVSEYAKTERQEDMAETFKYMLTSNNKLPNAYNDEIVKNKAMFLIEWIEDNFEGVTEEAYWYKWFK